MEEIKAQLGETPVDKEIHVNATVFDWSVRRQSMQHANYVYSKVLFISLF